MILSFSCIKKDVESVFVTIKGLICFSFYDDLNDFNLEFLFKNIS